MRSVGLLAASAAAAMTALTAVGGAATAASPAVSSPTASQLSAPQTSSFAATKDTFAITTYPTKDRGVYPYLRVSADPGAISYVGFDVSGIPADAVNVSATLTLPRSGGNALAPRIRASLVGAWDERTTWATKPAVGAQVAEAIANPTGSATVLDVTGALPSTRNGAVSLALQMPSGAGFVYFSARETGTPAKLDVTWSRICGLDAKAVPTCAGQILFGAASGLAGTKMTYSQVMGNAADRYGRDVPVWRSYAPPGTLPMSPNDPVGSGNIAHVRAGGIAQVNWKPDADWSKATGSNATVNAWIDRAADNIKAVAPGTVMLTLHHEPQNDVGGGTSCSHPGTNPNMTPANYRAMWRNVYNRFQAKGVTNVLWLTGDMGFAGVRCLVPEMWPGDDIVDWVGFDKYWGAKGSATVDAAIGEMYRWYQANSVPGRSYSSKPIALTEFGMNNPNAAQSVAYQGYRDLAAAVQSGKYPGIKMMLVWDSNRNGDPVRTDLDGANVADPVEQAEFNELANLPQLKPYVPMAD